MSLTSDNYLAASHYIRGEWLESSGRKLLSRNPANHAIIWQGNMATAAEVNLAGFAAHEALPDWAIKPIGERIAYLQNFATIVIKNHEKLSRLIALETGKPLWEAETETNSVINKVKASIHAHQERSLDKKTELAGANAYVRYKPQGVVAIFGPFNFPAHTSNSHIVPALLAGNTILYKPSELTPAVAKLMMSFWHEAGLPKGVINCLQGDKGTGQLLLAEKIHGVFFTGSYQTGKRIHQQFADRPEVILALEMGGNNPLIIAKHQNLQAAIYHTILSTLITAGQRCSCARRIFIPDDNEGEQFLDALIAAYKKVKIGSFDSSPQPFIGPVIGYEHAQTYVGSQQELIDQGGDALLTMKLLEKKTGFLSPGLIDMTKATQSQDLELFAPITQVYRYQDFNEALHLANQTHYGLVTALLCDDENLYNRFYQSMNAGLINWNKATTGASPYLPFGGRGFSGNNRPSGYFATDYCSYPVANIAEPNLQTPETLLPGIDLNR